ncbi:hypothetical protein F2Q69_00044631 [Brassica cretica]|uniref:Sodium/calcium exchanger membrane region domain-containing protein n=1 Tax=Brassica cretica TaxID=69181 RepID=A0A8S9N849_BRACR|nr:hypothetical protein F2Q69_00044631 [Brassica cretica]
MLSERRAALGLPSRDPEESDPNRQQQSNPTEYFDNDGAQIALSGCYAGPLFNTVIGLGVPLVITSLAEYPGVYIIPSDNSLLETLGFLMVGLLWALVIMPKKKMRLDRLVGGGLLAIYLCFLFLRLARVFGVLDIDR